MRKLIADQKLVLLNDDCKAPAKIYQGEIVYHGENAIFASKINKWKGEKQG